MLHRVNLGMWPTGNVANPGARKFSYQKIRIFSNCKNVFLEKKIFFLGAKRNHQNNLWNFFQNGHFQLFKNNFFASLISLCMLDADTGVAPYPKVIYYPKKRKEKKNALFKVTFDELATFPASDFVRERIWVTPYIMSFGESLAHLREAKRALFWRKFPQLEIEECSPAKGFGPHNLESLAQPTSLVNPCASRLSPCPLRVLAAFEGTAVEF